MAVVEPIFETFKDSYDFGSEERRKKLIKEKVELLDDFFVPLPRSYKWMFNEAKTPIELDRIAKGIIVKFLKEGD